MNKNLIYLIYFPVRFLDTGMLQNRNRQWGIVSASRSALKLAMGQLSPVPVPVLVLDGKQQVSET